MTTPIIKVGFLVSYDYAYMKYALPPVYEQADKIVIAVDIDRQTWKGEKFDIPASFFEWIKAYDKDNKIEIYEDSFFVPELNAFECDTRERNMLAKKMGDSGWHIQVDSDEYFLDFKILTRYLKALDTNKPVTIYAELITIFRQDSTGMFLIDSNEQFALATNNPVYIAARRTDDKMNTNVYTKFKLLHQSWGRSEAEMEQKLKNWGHTSDFEIESYFSLWKAINKYTYKYLQNFHPLTPSIWKELEYFETNDIPTLLEKVKEAQMEKEEKEKKKSKFCFFRKKKG